LTVPGRRNKVQNRNPIIGEGAVATRGDNDLRGPFGKGYDSLSDLNVFEA